MATSDAWNVSACGETILPGLTWEEMEPSQAKNGKDREWTRPRDIPLDIARLIFEKAMEDTPAPVHLALVSRQVQHWIEPFIYRHLVFRCSKKFSHFYRTFRNRRFSPTKPTSFFAEHVQTLYILSGGVARTEQITAIGRVMRSLRAAAGWDNSWGRLLLGFLASDCGEMQGVRVVHTGSGWRYSMRGEREAWRDEAEKQRRAGFDDNLLRGWIGQEAEGHEGMLSKAAPRDRKDDKKDPFAYKDLRRLSISTFALRAFRIDLTHRMFRDLTHLDIYYYRLFDWSTITAMKNLTHLAVDLLTHVDLPFTAVRHFIEELTQSCQSLPRLKVIIFACISWWSRDFDLLDDEDEVVAPLNFSTEEWDTSGPLISAMNDEHHLHYFTQLCLGMHDPRTVLGVVSDCLPSSHLMKDYMIDLTWPKNYNNWDFTVQGERHQECWDFAEDIVEKRVRDRMERRRKAGVDDPSQRVDGEFGFGEVVRRQWEILFSS